VAKKIVSEDSLIEYLYDESLDGTEMETGDTDSGLWVGGMSLVGDDWEKLEEYDGYGEYGKYSHAIITQDTYGFKRVELYETRDEYDNAFMEYETEYGGMEDFDDE
jgi:hypothetical protein